jgi:flavin-binding protein dodecin
VADATFKITELVGESSEGIEQAVPTAIKTSAAKVRGHSWAHITDLRANRDGNGGVEKWQVTVNVAFAVE